MFIIAEIVELVHTRKVPPSLVCIAEDIGHKDLRFLAIDLLNWLSKCHTKKNKKPLHIDPEAEWKHAWIKWLAADQELSFYFELDNENFDFKTAIPEEQKAEIQKFAYDNYKPLLTWH